jgi:TetR/AcrR family transcriptional regulator
MKKTGNDMETSYRKIISAAVKEFSISGFHGARVDAIAIRSGANKAMIYYHFKSKKGLYISIIEELFDKIYALISEQASLEAPANERLYRTVESISNFIRGLDDDMRRVMIWEIASGGNTLLSIKGRTIARILPLVLKIYDDAIKEGYFRKDLNPLLTHAIIIGSLVTSNIIHMIASKSTLYKTLFKLTDFRGKFTSNLISILKTGIEAK